MARSSPNDFDASDTNNPISLERSTLNTTVPQLEEAIELQSDASARVVGEAIIPLLEERLMVDRHKRKVAEVVVRKEIETHIVEVPIRREKLIVEQVSPEYEQLAVVDLGQAQAYEINPSNDPLPPTVSAKFTSTNAAIEFLEAIAAHSNSGLTTVQVSVVLVDENLQAVYQQWLEQHST